MDNILITGAAGNIGSALLHRLLQLGDFRVVGIDNMSTGSREKLPQKASPKFHFIKADVNRYEDISAIMLAHSFRYVFHYAAVVGVKRTLDNPVMVLNDIQGIRNVLELSKSTGVSRVFYSSSSEVYGEPVEFPQNEHTTPLNSRLPYAVVKNVGEAFLRSYQREFGLDFTIFRFFNTYGPRQSEDFVISRFIRQALLKEDLTIYGAGTQTRTFCYIDDNIDTTVACLTRDLHLNDVINIGSEEEITIKALAEKIIELTGSPSHLKFLPALSEGDMTRRRPDNARMKSILNRPLIGLDEGIKRTIDQRLF